MMKRMQIDRFEGNLVVLADDDMKTVDIPKDFFPFAVHEGDILEIEFDGTKPVSARFIADETEAAKARTKSLMERLKNKKR